MDKQRFTASVVPGSKRGRTLGFPTLNLSLNEIPSDLKHGIYACFVEFEDSGCLPAVMHYGPRPVFADTLSCEIYVIDRVITSPPQKLHVSVMNRIRDIKSFPLSGMLEEQIKSDIDVAKRILS